MTVLLKASENENGLSTKNSSTSHRLRNLLFILVIIVAILVIVTLGLTVYLVVKLNVDEPQSNVPQLTTTTITPLPSWPPPSTSPMGIFDDAAVAADNGICSEIGRNVLIKGGNAVDSSIAVLFCIGVMNPQSSGIGGGHFMTIYNRTTKSCVTIDAREVAPGAADENMFADTDDGSETGYLAIAVPGQLAGLWTAYKQFGGGVSWASLVEPTIDLCENGYPVSSALARSIAINIGHILNETTLHIFINNKTGRPYQVGEIMTRPVFGATLRQISLADDPVQLFYNSSMTKTMVEEIQAGGGIVTEEDFLNYTVKWGAKQRPIITTQLKGNLRACGPPPPSSGSVTMAILNILDGYNITPNSLLTVDSNVEVYHRLIEAMKFAYAARELLGDMDFVPSALDVAYNITTPWYGEHIRSKILGTAQNQSYYENGFSFVEDHGTSHMSVVDSVGHAVSVTSTINLNFGAKVRSATYGIIWNDEMDDFSQPNKSNIFNYTPTPSNFIVPGKRPLSSMSPLVVYDANSGEVIQASGVAGGSRIISAAAQILLRTLYFNQTIKEALDSPRLHNQLQPFYTEYETGFPQVYVEGLQVLGQHMKKSFGGSAGTGIERSTTDGLLYASSDYRKGGGFPSGY